MNKCTNGATGRWFWTVAILLMAVKQSSQWGPFGWFGGGATGELSHFSGAIGPNDVLCAKRLVGRGTRLPVDIPFTTSIPIQAFTAEANQYNRQGFQVVMKSGAMGSNALTLSISGPRTMPYFVIVDFFCTP